MPLDKSPHLMHFCVSDALGFNSNLERIEVEICFKIAATISDRVPRRRKTTSIAS